MGERPQSVFSGSGRGQLTAPAASTPGDLTALWWEGRGTAARGSSTRHLLLTGQVLAGLFSGCPSPGLWGPAETSHTLTPILPLNFRYTRRPPTLKPMAATSYWVKWAGGVLPPALTVSTRLGH